MLSYPGGGKPLNGTFKAVERWQSHQLRCPKDLDELLRGFRPLFAYHDHLLEGREIPLATVEEFFKTGAVSQFSGDPKDLMLLQGQRNCYEYLRERVLARDDLETSLVLEVHRILTSGTYTEPFYLVNGERPGELKKRDYVTAVNAVGAAARAGNWTTWWRKSAATAAPSCCRWRPISTAALRTSTPSPRATAPPAAP